MTEEIRSWSNVDRRLFDTEILPAGKPAILKGLAAQWPLVRAGRTSPAAAAAYLSAANPDTPVDYLLGDPSIKGRFFYTEALTDVNFRRARASFGSVLKALVSLVSHESPPAISLQALSASTVHPRLKADHPLDLVPPETPPRLWIGNAVTVAPHFDINDNIACVACGRRRFTLFPPEQLMNLYVGPLDFTPQGVPISLVDVSHPDLARFPRFETALEAAQTAEVDAGDAVFIPYLWWHSVQSLSRFNVLINYWWNSASRSDVAPYHALLHAITTVGRLPPAQRDAWRAFFDHYVFAARGDPAEHIAPERRGILGSLSGTQVDQQLLELARLMSAGRRP